MSEPKNGNTGHQPDTAPFTKETPPLDWRRTTMGLGMLTLVVALFAAASGKDVGSLLAKGLLVVACILMAVPILTNISHSLSSKIKRLSGATTKPGS